MGKLLSSGIVGLLFGFGFSIVPSAVRYLGAVSRFVIAFLGAFAGSWVAAVFGLSTNGFSAVTLVVDLVVGYLVALLVVAVLDRIAAP